MPVDATAAGAAVLEIERFEWAEPGRIEIVGYWSGLRGRRFMRPTLVLKGEGEPKRLLAVLDHKPWEATDGEEWVAAFAWDGAPVKFESADLNVGSGIDVELPPPRMRPGKPRRFRHRAVSRDASREDAPWPRAAGIVSDRPKKKPKKATDSTLAIAPPSKRRKVEPDPTLAIPPPGPVPSRAEPEPEPEPTVAIDAPAADPAAPATDAPATEPPAEDSSHAELEAARADVERLRGERDGFRRERDSANEKVRALRAELEAERQGREKAVAEARAGERETATRMLAEGAEVRAAVERQREIAYLERDDAKAERDRAVEARDKALAERDLAIQARKLAERERKDAFAERDHSIKLRDRADAERAKAVALRDDALAERERATKERDEIVSVHERGLPVHPPQPRFLPDDERPRSNLEVWGPRGVAIGVLLLLAFIVLRLFAGA